jgi:hypothetical protein
MIVRPAQTSKRQVSRTVSIQAPTGGLNARDAIANMKETDATIMTNWFPSTASVDVRNGYQSHATGMTGNIETLMSYSYGATQELYGIVDGDIFNVTSAGAVGAAVVTGLTNSRFEYILMGTAGGNFLMAVNGADKMRIYTGSAWYADGTTTTVTGFDTATASHINNFKSRVFFIEKNKLKAWYLPVSSIAGAANSLDFSGIFKLGGYLMCMTNWTIDNAAGIDDYAAFITSEGEVAIYQGTDPSSSTTWALKGTFRIGKPIGRRCAIKAGADVLVLTTDGAFPLSKALLTDRSQIQVAVTDKITNLITSDIKQYSSNFGWQPIIHPTGNKLLLNIPSVEGSVSHQYVMNTITGAWCKFTGWNSFCYELLGNKLYFGGVNAVFEADTESDDNGSDIMTDVQQAFSNFGDGTAQKHFKMVRPIFVADSDVTPALVMNVDYGTREPVDSATYVASSGAVWDVAPWDTSDWESGDVLIRKWQSVTGIGYSGGVRIQTASSGTNIRWQALDIVYERGGVL